VNLKIACREEKEVQKAKQLINEIKAVYIVKCHCSSGPAVKESHKKKLNAVSIGVKRWIT